MVFEKRESALPGVKSRLMTDSVAVCKVMTVELVTVYLKLFRNAFGFDMRRAVFPAVNVGALAVRVYVPVAVLAQANVVAPKSVWRVLPVGAAVPLCDTRLW